MGEFMHRQHVRLTLILSSLATMEVRETDSALARLITATAMGYAFFADGQSFAC